MAQASMPPGGTRAARLEVPGVVWVGVFLEAFGADDLAAVAAGIVSSAGVRGASGHHAVDFHFVNADQRRRISRRPSLLQGRRMLLVHRFEF